MIFPAQPQDLGREQGTQGTYFGNFRFKGFPNNNFTKASVPRTISPTRSYTKGPATPPQQRPAETREYIIQLGDDLNVCTCLGYID